MIEISINDLEVNESNIPFFIIIEETNFMKNPFLKTTKLKL